MYENKTKEELLIELQLLKKQVDQYKLVSDNSADVIFMLDMTLKYTFISPSIKELRGYTPEEILNKPLSNSLTPHSLNYLQHIFSEAMIQEKTGNLNTTTPLRLELEMYHKNGSTLWVEVKVYIIRDANNQMFGILGISHDISEHFNFQKKLERKNQTLIKINTYAQEITEIHSSQLYSFIVNQLKNISGASIGLMSIYNEENKILDCVSSTLNQKDSNIIQKLLGKNIIGFKTPVTDKTYKEITSEIIALKKTITEVTFGDINPRISAIIQKLTGYVWFAGIALMQNNKLIGTIILAGTKNTNPSESEEFLAFAGITANAIAKATVKKELQVSESHYHLITDKTTDVVWVMDLKGKSLFVSPSIEKFTGYSVDEYLNQTIQDRFSPETSTLGLQIFAHELELINTNPEKLKDYSIKLELEYVCKNGGTKWGELLITPYYDSSNTLTGIHGVTRDITDRKLTENLLIEKNNELLKAKEHAEESDRLKTAFLANMSHEIRTPMNGILGFSQMLGRKKITPEKQQQYIDIIKISGNHLMTIIDDLIDIAKIEANQIIIDMQPIDLDTSLDELFALLEPLASIKNITLIKEIKKSLNNQTILCDNNRLRQILINLINNAVKFTTTGYVKFGYHLKQPNTITFFIKDTGIGINPVFHSKIFDRFIQVESGMERNFGGTGLGLAISKALVELLGGTIWFESTLNKGSTFYFTIPLVHVKQKTVKKAKSKTHYNTDTKRTTILIAEDEELNYTFIDELLKDYQFDLKHAINGKEAIEMAENDASIDIILMDLKMPVINGYEATIEIKKSKPDLPIIAQTAYAQSNDRQKALDAGCDDYITKPISIEILLELLDKYK